MVHYDNFTFLLALNIHRSISQCTRRAPAQNGCCRNKLYSASSAIISGITQELEACIRSIVLYYPGFYLDLHTKKNALKCYATFICPYLCSLSLIGHDIPERASLTNSLVRHRDHYLWHSSFCARMRYNQVIYNLYFVLSLT